MVDKNNVTANDSRYSKEKSFEQTFLAQYTTRNYKREKRRKIMITHKLFGKTNILLYLPIKRIEWFEEHVWRVENDIPKKS